MRAGSSALAADGVDGRICRSACGIGESIEQVADGCLTLLAVDAELAETLRAGVARSGCGSPGAVLHTAGGWAHQSRFRPRAGEQGGDQRPSGDAADKRDQGRFAERVDCAVLSAAIGFDRALAGRYAT